MSCAGNAEEAALSTIRMLRNATLYVMKYTYISICLEDLLLRLTKFDHFKGHVVDPSSAV